MSFTLYPLNFFFLFLKFYFIFRSEGLYNTIDELRLQQPLPAPGLPGGVVAPMPYSTFRSPLSETTTEFSEPEDFSG